MAGQLTIDTLKASTGVLATQNGMTGIAKAWATFTGGNGNTAGTVVDSFNVSSITVNGTGDFTVNYTTAMPNATYAFFGAALEQVNDASQATNRLITPVRTAPLTTSIRVACTYNVNAQRDTCYYAYVSIMSN